MTTNKLAKWMGGAAVTGLLLAGGAGMALAQTTPTYANPDGTGSVIPTVSATDTGGTTGTTGTDTTGTTGTTGMTTTGATGTTGTTATTPGVPNTGAGGDASGVLLTLGLSALVAIAGGAYLSRQKFAAR